jgi:hypothetical protein
MKAIAEVFTYISENNLYEDNDWQENSPEDHYAALMRHLDEWWMNESKATCLDHESNLHTLKHVLANAAILVFLGTEE